MKDKYKKVIEFIYEFAKNVEIKIAELAAFNALTPEEKKARVDEFAIMLATQGIDKLPINPIVKMIIKGFMVKYMSAITQVIYDLIKAKVDGITK